MDLSQLSTADLQALQAGDLSKVSTAGLRHLQAGQRRVDQAAADRVEFDPTKGMGPGERVLAGIGSGMTSAIRAIGGDRAATALGLPSRAEADTLDKPLTNTTAGKVGQVIGVAAPAALAVPFTPLTFAGAGLAGAGTGAALTEGGVGDRMQGAGMGALGGLAGQALPGVVRAGYGALRGLAEPFTRGGVERIAGRTIGRFATQPPAAVPTGPTVTGARQTLAEAARDPGLATLERAIGQLDPQAAQALAARAAENNAARVGTLEGIAGGPQARAAAEAARDAASKPLYDTADQAVVQLDGVFKGLLGRPAFRTAASQAEKLARNEGLADLFFRNGKGQPVAITGQGAHYIKKAMDDALDRTSPTYMGESASRATATTQRAFLDWLEQQVPEYNAARTAFADASVPLNRMDVGQRLLDKTTAATRDLGGNQRLQANAFAKALNDEEALIKAATGQRVPKALADLMTPDELDKISGVRNELETIANLQALANGPNSQTAKALASQNLVRQVAGPLGLPQGFLEGSFAGTLQRPFQWGFQAAEPRIQAAIAQGLIDPAEGLWLLQIARRADAQTPPNALGTLLRRSAPAAIGGLSAYGAGQ